MRPEWTPVAPRTRCAILLLENASVRLIGHGEAPSQGWKKSRITDQNEVAESIRAALTQAESEAQVPIGSAVFGLGGAGIASSNARGGYEIGFARQIDQNDINRVVDRASRVQLQEDEMLLHLFPRDFAVDGRPGYRNPRGMIGSRLEVFVHLVTSSAHEHRSLVGAANQAHLLVEETVFEPVAGAYAAIMPDGREEGIALIDIGAHSTDLAVYFGEVLIYCCSLPVCGGHFTSDVAHGLLVTTEDAEWIKEQQGCAMLSLTGDNSLIEVPSASGRAPRETRRRDLNMILEARALELFELRPEGARTDRDGGGPGGRRAHRRRRPAERHVRHRGHGAELPGAYRASGRHPGLAQGDRNAGLEHGGRTGDVLGAAQAAGRAGPA